MNRATYLASMAGKAVARSTSTHIPTAPILSQIPNGSSAFHTSAAANARLSKRTKGLFRIQKHFARQLQKPKVQDVDPILGRESVPFVERMRATLSEPENISFLLTAEETEKLIYGAEQAAILRRLSAEETSTSAEPMADALTKVADAKDARKREAVRRILSMQNSSLEERKRLAVKLAVSEFGRFEGDTGSSEVQAAVSTIHIQFLATHLKENKNDLKSKDQLQQLVQDRQSILKYLRRQNPERYYWTIEKLGLSDEAVTSEFSISRRYLEKYQFFGVNTLKVKDNKKERSDKIKQQRLEKKAQKFLSIQKSTSKQSKRHSA